MTMPIGYRKKVVLSKKGRTAARDDNPLTPYYSNPIKSNFIWIPTSSSANKSTKTHLTAPYSVCWLECDRSRYVISLSHHMRWGSRLTYVGFGFKRNGNLRSNSSNPLLSSELTPHIQRMSTCKSFQIKLQTYKKEYFYQTARKFNTWHLNYNWHTKKIHCNVFPGKKAQVSKAKRQSLSL